MAAAAPASAYRSLGIDVEPREPFPKDVHDLILVTRDDVDGTLLTTFGETVCHRLIFSAKESIYKCLSPALRTELDFHDVQITVRPKRQRSPATGSFEAIPTAKAPSALNLLKRLRGRYVVTETHLVASLLWPTSLA
jgi:4'-phosphopantetheinyl transferase EntD